MQNEVPESDRPEAKQELIDTPPFFRSWRSWYAVVIGTLCALILLFYLFTKAFD